MSDALPDVGNNPEVEGRRKALFRLLSSAGPEPTAQLVSALGDPDWRVRKTAVAVIGAQGAEASLVAALLDALEQGDNVGLTNASVAALGELGSPSVAPLADRLSTLNADGRKLAAEALGRTGSVDALEPLATLMDDSDLNVRVAATEALPAAAGQNLARVEALLLGTLQADDELLQLVGLDGLKRISRPPPFERLRTLLSQPALREATLELAVLSPAPGVVEMLTLDAFGEPPSTAYSVARLAAYAQASKENAGRLKAVLRERGAAVEGRLATLAQAPGEPALAGPALLLLGVMGSPTLVAKALPWLGDEEVGSTAMAALAWLGPGAAAALVTALGESSVPLDWAHLDCLLLLVERLPEERALVARFLVRAEDRVASPLLRCAWLELLGRCSDPVAIEALAPWLVIPEPPAVYQTAMTAAFLLASRWPDEVRLARSDMGAQPALLWTAALVGADSGGRSAASDEELRSVMESSSHPLGAVRLAVVRALHRAVLSGDPRVAPSTVIELLNVACRDLEPAVRSFALAGLVQLPQDEGRLLVQAYALARTDPKAIVETLRALRFSRAPETVGVVAGFTKNREGLVAAAALEIACELGGEQKSEAIVTALQHGDEEVVKLAAMLADPTIEQERQALSLALEHPASFVRLAAVGTLAKTSAPAATAELRRRAGLETHDEVLSELSIALRLQRSVGGPQ